MTTRMTIGSGVISGSGMPTGTAPVGTVYVDTAATNGAVRWVYTPNGWTVEYGDTGLRNIASLIIDPSVDTTYGNMRAAVRRVNAVVMLDLEIKTPAAVISPVVPFKGIFPSGFGIEDSSGLYAAKTYENLNNYMTKPDGPTLYGAAAATVYRAYEQWFTRDAWPASLPGTAMP